jgi:hypothetical protein
VSAGEKGLYLYKLHGSIDWLRDQDTSKLTYSDSTSKIRIDEGVLIFGTMYKLQYLDPFLFLVYQLRRLSLDAKLLLVIGYGFGDEHINGILAQALRGSQNKRLIAVTSFAGLADPQKPSALEGCRQRIAKELGLDGPYDPRLVIIDSKANEFLTKQLSLPEVSKYFPPEEVIFEQLEPGA